MRDRFPLLVVGGLLLFAFLGSSLLSGARRGDFADDLSTWRAGDDGARALFLLAQESGLPVVRHQADLLTPKDGQTLVLLGVAFDSDRNAKKKLPDEQDEEEDYASIFQPDGGVEMKRGLNTFFVDGVSHDEQQKLLEHVKKGNTVIYVSPERAKNNGFLGDVGLFAYAPEVDAAVRTMVAPVPTPYTLGVQRVEARANAFFDVPEEGTALLVDERSDEAVIALVPYGAGQVIAVGSSDLAMNQALLRGDNAQLWLSLLRATAGSKPTAFDEFHHGFAGDRSVAEFARRYGLHYAIAQLIVGLALWAMALKRFGRPKLPPEDERVAATDALSATSRLYREGRHFGFAAQLIVRELAHEMARAASMPARSDHKAIAARLRQREKPAAADAFEKADAASRFVSSEVDVQNVATLAAQARALLATKPRQSPKLVA